MSAPVSDAHIQIRTFLLKTNDLLRRNDFLLQRILKCCTFRWGNDTNRRREGIYLHQPNLYRDVVLYSIVEDRNCALNLQQVARSRARSVGTPS